MAFDRRQVMQAAVAVVALVAAVVLLAVNRPRQPGAAQAWYFDLQSGQLFPGDPAAIPPIDAPSGAGRGVVATVYGCGDCADEHRQIGHLFRFSDDARKVFAAGFDPKDPKAGPALMAVNAGRLVAARPQTPGQEPRWIPQSSLQGDAIVLAGRPKCPEMVTLLTCTPAD